VNVNAPAHAATATEKIKVVTIKPNTRAAGLIALLFLSHFLNLIITLPFLNLVQRSIKGYFREYHSLNYDT